MLLILPNPDQEDVSDLQKHLVVYQIKILTSTSKMHSSHPPAVRSNAVVLLLVICCLVCFPLVMGVLCLSLFCCASLYVISSFAISSWRRRESRLLCFYCLTDVLLLQMFCDSSSGFCGLVCGVWLWYFLIILIFSFISVISFRNCLNAILLTCIKR